MTRMPRLPRLLLALVLTPACEAGVEPAWLDQPGDPCRGEAHRCGEPQAGEPEVLRCEDDVLVARDCDVICSERGPAWVAEGCDRECVCVPIDPDGCWPGETQCADADTLERCDEGQQWAGSSCATACAEVGLNSTGCQPGTGETMYDSTPAACWCSGEGQSCSTGEAPRCVGDGAIASCVDGAWTVVDCAEVCGNAASCVPWQSPASCAC